MSVLQMSRTFMRTSLPQAALADREWQASVFCLFTQLFNEGQALMDDAANRKPEYRNDRALFFGQAAPEPAPGVETPDQPPKKSSLLEGVPVPPAK
jgi:hypothetical protein